MRIQGPSIINPKRYTSSANRPSSTAPSRADGAELSSAASELADAKGPEVLDMERVDRLRKSIQNGSFRIDPDAIAERMLDEEV
ncbi:MAG: flagellar biosynthesis anti-sigma factor FlgM [Myxococcota bacterium]